MEDTYTFAGLVNSYGQFRVPVAKVKIGGSELEGVGIENVSVTLSKEEASSVQFQVTGAYDRKASGFSSAIKSRLRLGNVISVSLGYGSELVEVFKGYISEVGAELSEAPVLTVTGMDVRRLMMEGDSRSLIRVAPSLGDMFKDVMKPYTSICGETITDDKTKEDPPLQTTQLNSDYEFVRWGLTDKGNRDFWVAGNTAYFCLKDKFSAPIMTLKWGESLLSFSRSAMYQNLDITVVGFDEEKKEVLQAQVTEKSDEAQTSAGSANKVFIADTASKEESKLRKRAEKEAAKRKKKAQNGSATCIGLPVLVPGRYVELEGMDPDLDAKYYISEVRHEWGTSGAETSITIGGWEK